MLILFQILFTMFVLFAIVNVIKRKQEGLLGPKGLFFWLIFWLLAIVAVLWPNSTTILANYLGIGRGTDFVIYVALVIIFYLLFKLHIKLESVGRDITKVVRREAVGEGVRNKE
ncbi:MAG TPA: DUF2304 domain-containing protein [Candidatus Magasanikbacteria bacterium]|nr:DUF2304 domain-containing protein [Candidatus Magasanikbacteria bacterium]